MVKNLKLKDFDSALGLASSSTKKLIRASVPDAKNSFPELLSKYRFSGTRDFNMGLIIIAFFNYCLRSDNGYIKKFAQGAARAGTMSNKIFLNLAEGNGKEIKKHMANNDQFEMVFNTILESAEKDKNKKTKIIQNFINQAGKITPWVTNGNEIKFLIKSMFGSAFDLKLKEKKKTGARDAKKLVNAAKTDDYKTVLSLLKTGMNVNAIDLWGHTALLYAAEKGHTEIVELLLNNGANVDAIDKDGVTALMGAAYEGHTEIVELLLNNGADVDAKDKYGNTALIWETKEGHTEVVKFLLDHGADVNAENKNGYTALIWATTFGCTDAIKLLLEHGANVDAKNNYGDTALMKASEEGHTEIVKLLIKKGADVNLTNKQGKDALSIALQKKSLDIIWQLINSRKCTLNDAHKKLAEQTLANVAGGKDILDKFPSSTT